jgi:hypothetical protein
MSKSNRITSKLVTNSSNKFGINPLQQATPKVTQNAIEAFDMNHMMRRIKISIVSQNNNFQNQQTRNFKLNCQSLISAAPN